MVDAFRKTGAEIILMDLDRSQGLLSLIRNLIALFHENKPDFVHVQYMAPGFAPIVAARLSGVRNILATVHQPGRNYNLKAKCLLRGAAFLCSSFFCVSQAADKSWFGSSELFEPGEELRSSRKHYTIYNAIDFAEIESIIASTDSFQLKKSLGIDNCSIVGVVGRLREEKGQVTLIKAMPKVIQTIPNTCLLVVGDGPDKNKLQAMAVNMGVNDHICWIGEKEPNDVISYYSIIDVAVSPSKFEGFGLAAAEAMAAGCPVIASNIDGLNEVVTHGRTGFLVAEGDSSALSDHIIELLFDMDKAAAMGKEGRKKVKRLFSVERFAETILEVYRS